MKRSPRQHPKYGSAFRSLSKRFRRRNSSRYLRLEILEKRHLLAAASEVQFDTELTDLNLTGGPFPMPLASDVGNVLGDSIDGFGFVNSTVAITLSSQRPVDPGPASAGFATGFPGFFVDAEEGPQENDIGSQHINPDELDGQPFFVESFFDVFFDITVTDVDPRPGRNFATGTPEIVIQDVGPAMLSSFSGEREPIFFDKDAPNYGLLPPPEAEPYVGHFDIVIDLSTVFGQTVDINQNGEEDLLKFTLATHSAGDENREFIVLPDGTTLDKFDTAAFLEGAVLDASDDPPFTIGGMDPQTGLPIRHLFGGPTTARALTINSIIEEDVFEYGLAEIELIHPDTTREIVKLAGSNTVHVFFDGAEGDATDDDGDNLDEVPTEMVALSLRGNSSLGPLEVRLNPGIPTVGEIEELVNNNPGLLDIDPFAPGDASSFFDVFFEIEVGGQVLHTDTPKRMSTVITEKPPVAGDVYESPETIELLDAAGAPTGFSIGSSRHEPSPEVEVDVFPTSLAQLVLDVGGTQRNATLTGPSTVVVNIPPDGTAVDTDGDGLDQVPAEMTELNLTGFSDLGPLSLTLNPHRRSLGEIEETANNTPGTLDVDPFAATGTADSFFDVFFEVRVGEQVLHNETAVTMASTISQKPPAQGEPYIGVGEPVVLFDELNNPTNFVLVDEIHIPNPGEVDRFDNTVAEVVLEHPGGATERITLVGPSIVVVDIPPDGSADDSDGNNLDDVDTEMVDMFLRGNSSLGPVIVKQSRDLRSFGIIEENADNNTGVLDVDPFAPGTADSFFDVFFDFEVPSVGVSLHNEDPAIMQATLTNKPPNPGDRYFFNTPVDLLDPEGEPTGFSILREIHHPNPPIEVDEFPLSVGDIMLELPDGSTEQISLVGPSTVHVFFDGPLEGDAIDDDGNGLDEVPIQLVDLNLQGSSSLGPLTVRLNTGVPSLGQIEETVNNTPGILDVDPFAPGNADSFFDVFFEIEVGGQTIFNLDPARLDAVIREKPPAPGDTYRGSLSNPVELFRFDPRLGLVPAGRLLRERHMPDPTVEVDTFQNTVGQLIVQSAPDRGILTPDPSLPPAYGDYRTAPGSSLQYDAGPFLIEVGDVALRPIPESAVVTPIGADEIINFDATIRALATIDGSTFPVTLGGQVQTIVLGKVGNTTGTFDTEIVSMELSGEVPGGPILTLRESPTLASPGETTITDLGGGQFAVDSFFDVFTEVSIVGSPFIPAAGSAQVVLVHSGVDQSSPEYPPAEGVYRPQPGTQTTYDLAGALVTFRDTTFQRVADVIRANIGDDQVQAFNTDVTVLATINAPGLDGTFPVTLTGPVETLLRGKAVRDTGTFDTEIVSMNLAGTFAGDQPLLVRLDPLTPTFGLTQITDLGNGQFNVDSFFDVFTEISLDGGATWTVGDVPIPIDLVEPRQHIVTLGDSEANVYFEGAFEGDAVDDDLDGLDEVESELTQLNLQGNSPLGPLGIHLDPRYRSVGRIEERLNNNPGLLDVEPFATGDADSFFDVYFEIEVGGQTLRLPVPSRLQSVIDDKPPKEGERYEFDPPRPIELVDAMGNPTGLFVVREVHDVDPTIEVDEFPFTLAEIDLLRPDGGSETVHLTGPSTVHVFFEGPFEGDASDDNRDGLDEVATELVEMTLTGQSSLGPIVVRLDRSQRSIGSIEETINNHPGLLDIDPFAPGDANSFFDVFFEIEVGGQVLRGAQNARLESLITNKPPGKGEMYLTPVDQSIVLVDAGQLDTGFRVTRIKHTPTCGTTVTNVADSGAGSLRFAILCANATPGVQTIDFNIPGTGTHVISPLTQLPVITDPVFVDARTQPGYSGTPVVQLDGSTAITDGLVVTSGGSFISGLSVTNFTDAGIEFFAGGSNIAAENYLGIDPAGVAAGNYFGVKVINSPGNEIAASVVSGNLRNGVFINGVPATGNIVDTNLIGTDPTGTAAVPNLKDGVSLFAPGNTITSNLISGNNGFGVFTRFATGGGNVIDSNTIGLDLAGTAPLSNVVGITLHSPGNQVTDNTISGNVHGVAISGADSDGNTITGNAIGTDAAGNVDLGNTLNGVIITGSQLNGIGGFNPGEENIISGNGRNGVLIAGSAGQRNFVQGNKIGVNGSGSAAIPNDGDGVRVTQRASRNVIRTNQIAGNLLRGVAIAGDGTSGNRVVGNRIGTNAAATSPLHNSNDVAVLLTAPGNEVSRNLVSAVDAAIVSFSAFAVGNTISGNTIGSNPALATPDGIKLLGGSVGTSVIGNTIANGQRGIVVTGVATRNDLSQNVLFGNSNIGIDLGDDGATANDSADIDEGPNRLQNTPTITAATVISGTDLQITYFVNTLRRFATYPMRVEFFATNDNQARVLLGTDFYTGADRAAGAKTITLSSVVSLLASGDELTATATDADGNTSELSLGFLISGIPE